MEVKRLTNRERATNLYIRDKVIQPISKRTNIANPIFRGASLEVQTLELPEVVLEGAAGSGKTLAILYKLHQLALNNPGARILIVRKTRESMNESVLATFEQDVLGESSELIPKGQRNARHSYNYPNGAQIIIAGLQTASQDQRERIMSSSYDVCFVCECSELSESDWNRITSRLRNGKMDYQGILGDLNPTTPSHWLYVREAHGKVKILQSYHKDNPALFDGNDWTPKGKAYINKLSNLTGLDRVRLFEGRRGSAQGVIYSDVWQDGALDGNVTEAAEYVPEMRFDAVKQKEIDVTSSLYWFCDDGYVGSYDEELQQFTAQSHPRVILLAQVRDDGKVCIFEESFKVQTLPERHIKMVEELGYAEPFKCVVDKSAVDLIARLNERYNAMQQKIVDVEEGIKLVRSYVAADENGVRKLLVHPRCRFTRFEFASYKRDEKGKILKEHDHACLVAGTLIHTHKGDVPIELVEPCDSVLTRYGFRNVSAAGITGTNQKVFEVVLSNGNSITGTDNHPVFVVGKGFVPIDALRYGDIIEQIPYRRAKCQATKGSTLRQLSSMGLSLGDTLTQKIGATRCTTSQMAHVLCAGLATCIKKFGSRFTVKSRMDARYIIPTRTLSTIQSGILSVFPLANTRNFIQTNLQSGARKTRFPLLRQLRRLAGGVILLREWLGVKSLRQLSENLVGLMRNTRNTIVWYAEMFLSPGTCATTSRNFVPITASLHGDAEATPMTLRESALSVETRFGQTNTVKQNSVPVSVVRVRALKNTATVYNLTVDDVPEYYANGVLVHNCDAIRYGLSVIATQPRPNFRTLG